MPKLADTVAALARYRRQAQEPERSETGALEARELRAPNPGGLRMLTYAPAGLASRSPLVVVLHGCSQTAEGYAAGAGWLTLADHYGFAVLCPEQSRANNANLCFNWFEPADTTRGAGEAASIAQMISQTITDFDLDPRRVFITGLSAGGAMTAVMLATYPELFAAGALFAGLPHGAASNVQEAFQAMFQGASRPAKAWGDRVRSASAHKGPWPRVSIWHGDADSVVTPSASDELVKQWADVHGLDPNAGELERASDRRRTVWRTAVGECVLELHRIPRMAHGTPLSAAGPDGYGTAGPYLLDVGVPSSLEVAKTWGIAHVRLAASGESNRARPSAAERIESAPLNEGPARPAPPVGARVDVATVISQALRSAGLMK